MAAFIDNAACMAQERKAVSVCVKIAGEQEELRKEECYSVCPSGQYREYSTEMQVQYINCAQCDGVCPHQETVLTPALPSNNMTPPPNVDGVAAIVLSAVSETTGLVTGAVGGAKWVVGVASALCGRLPAIPFTCKPHKD